MKEWLFSELDLFKKTSRACAVPGGHVGGLWSTSPGCVETGGSCGYPWVVLHTEAVVMPGSGLPATKGHV